jgi:hypothetical protein
MWESAWPTGRPFGVSDDYRWDVKRAGRKDTKAHVALDDLKGHQTVDE